MILYNNVIYATCNAMGFSFFNDLVSVFKISVSIFNMAEDITHGGGGKALRMLLRM